MINQMPSQPTRRRMVLRWAAFALGALVAASAVDALAALCFDTGGGKNVLGGEVREVVRVSKMRDPRVELAYLGDSVARQLFRHGEETSVAVVHLTANISVSFAGHYFLIENAIASYPNLKTVVLITRPTGLETALDDGFTNDNFCAPFSEPRQMRDTFLATHDLSLVARQAYRGAYPNITSWIRKLDAAPPSISVPSIEVVERKTKSKFAIADDGPRAVKPSALTRVFLPKIRELCRAHGITFVLVPSPVPATVTYEDVENAYDAPIVYLDPSRFLPDNIHLLASEVADVRTHFSALLRRRSP